jgi:hypothetical protein
VEQLNVVTFATVGIQIRRLIGSQTRLFATMDRRKSTALAASPLILFFRWIIRRYSGEKKFN